MTKADTAEALATLAAWNASVRLDAVPDAIRARAALILADDLGAMIAARHEPELIALRDGVAASAGHAEASVLDGSGTRLDRYSAALSNGTAADWCELDGGYRRVVCHAALYCISALIAEAEARDATLDDVLLALLVGYETVARVGEAFHFADLVLHPHGGLATIGAAASVAKLRGDDAATTHDAIATAATLVLPGPFNHAVEGALVRNAWPGLCAQNGLRAADWARIGVTGNANSLYEVFAGIFGGTARPAALCEGLGARWAVSDCYHKMHACCQYGHSTVEAVLEAIGTAGALSPDAIRAIHVDTHPKGRKLDNDAPATTLASKFSVQHIAAATAVFGAAGSAAFHADTLTEPALAALRTRVTIGPFEPELAAPNDRPARVAITLSDGTRLSGECLSARGGPDRPFAQDAIEAKTTANFDGLYAPLLDALLDAARGGRAAGATGWRALLAPGA
ncbi:MmgE/PrpD family protein [Acuticoccus kandeliae]|uniref:MmgE/PrpD family protein n=1 Tax=Acuticoccus kandeliae TaxID=2073160 RepID=UPI000D3E12FB|nr:MmgE/PrpD family protein [Acuticoccus kandeliae]